MDIAALLYDFDGVTGVNNLPPLISITKYRNLVLPSILIATSLPIGI